MTKTDYKKRKSRVWAWSLSLLWSAWQYKGWHQRVEDGQRWERKGLETIWNNRKREREQGSERGRDFKTEEGKAEAKRRAAENLLKCHFTLTQKLWKCFAIFHVKKKKKVYLHIFSFCGLEANTGFHLRSADGSAFVCLSVGNTFGNEHQAICDTFPLKTIAV